MKLYEYDAAIEALIDEETGEIMDYEAYTKLDMARDEKITNTALYVKELKAEADAVKAIADRYTERAKALNNHATRVKEYLETYLAGEKFKNEKINVYYGSSTSTEIDENALLPDEYMVIKAPEFNKDAIKKALNAGVELEGCRLVKSSYIVIR